MVLPPNMETPPLATTANPMVATNPLVMTTATTPAEKVADKPDDNDDLISLGDEFEPRDPMCQNVTLSSGVTRKGEQLLLSLNYTCQNIMLS
jgi:hypothetical protein